jgi:hypothetical protein
MLSTAVCRLLIDDDLGSAPRPPHIAPGVRRCSAIAFRLGGLLMFLWATEFKFCRRQRDFSTGISETMFFGMGERPSPPFLSSPFLNYPVLADTP